MLESSRGVKSYDFLATSLAISFRMLLGKGMEGKGRGGNATSLATSCSKKSFLTSRRAKAAKIGMQDTLGKG